MNKLGLTSRICHSHVLKQQSINTSWMPQGLCPKQRKTNSCQDCTWGKKKKKKIILFFSSMQLFWDLFQYILWATTRGAETKHVVSIMHLDSISLELETLVFFSDCKIKRLKRGREQTRKGYSRLSSFGEGGYLCKILQCPQQLIQCQPEAKAVTELSSAESAGDCTQ